MISDFLGKSVTLEMFLTLLTNKRRVSQKDPHLKNLKDFSVSNPLLYNIVGPERHFFCTSEIMFFFQ